MNSETANENKSTRLLICTCATGGKADGSTSSAASVHHEAINTPTAPPASDNTALSVSTWRIRRARDAPSAMRTPYSCKRLVERASARFATFVHAISRTKPTAAPSAKRVGRKSPATSCLNETRFARVDALSSGYSASRFRMIASISACACANVTPAFRRPRPRVLSPVPRL